MYRIKLSISDSCYGNSRRKKFYISFTAGYFLSKAARQWTLYARFACVNFILRVEWHNIRILRNERYQQQKFCFSRVSSRSLRLSPIRRRMSKRRRLDDRESESSGAARARARGRSFVEWRGWLLELRLSRFSTAFWHWGIGDCEAGDRRRAASAESPTMQRARSGSRRYRGHRYHHYRRHASNAEERRPSPAVVAFRSIAPKNFGKARAIASPAYFVSYAFRSLLAKEPIPRDPPL